MPNISVLNSNNIGFNIGVRGNNAYVICNAKEKKAYEAQPGRKEWVTVVECICADGSAIPPLVIFKGENFQNGWISPDMDKDWQWTSNSKGWTCDVIAEDWIKRVFDPATCAKANGRQRTLVCDSHGSHVQPSIIRFCNNNKISLLLNATALFSPMSAS
jgi:hypothetical protein